MARLDLIDVCKTLTEGDSVASGVIGAGDVTELGPMILARLEARP